MKRVYSFKSLPMVPDPAGDANKIAYDMNGVRDHAMALSPAKFILCPSWIPNLFLALMAVALVFALAYGVLVIGMKVDMKSGPAPGIFILSAALLFIILWLVLGIPAVIRKLKWNFVVQERGTGSWKIIDDSQWEHFCRMRQLERERLKKEEEYRKAQQ